MLKILQRHALFNNIFCITLFNLSVEEKILRCSFGFFSFLGFWSLKSYNVPLKI